ncbi:MAG TPA: hypothetical protein PL051_00465 [Candidatus Saccharibacteria bacterium]|nr:hypothetical protein [Candidatus Saccharibacteria bacterium]
MDRRVRIFVLIFAIIFVGFVIFGIVVLISRIGKIAVDIQTFPEGAVVTMDGKSVGLGTQYISPGTHSFAASKTGWTTDKQTYTISKNTPKIAFVLDTDSPEATDYMERSPTFQVKREELSALRADLAGKNFRKQNEVVNVLPYSDVAGPYSIDYGFEEGNSRVYLIISDSTPSGRQKALQWLKDQGYDPINYRVTFPDYSPLVRLGER